MNSAVVAPMTVTNDSAVSDSSNSGLIRATMKMPAVTIVAAWISAEIGVGPSIESGSQTCSGTCADLPIAPTKRQMQMTVSSDHCAPPHGVHRRSGERWRAGRRPARSRASRSSARIRPMPEHEAEVADAVGEKRLEVRVDRRRPRVPEADQQVRDEADRLPAEEELDEVVAHHQHQHAEREQRDVAEEARVAGVVGHVADRVDVHHQRHERDDQHHRRRQRVDQEADRELEARRSAATCRCRR